MALVDFDVIEPASGREVLQAILAAIGGPTDRTVSVVLLARHKVPTPKPMPITFRVAATHHRRDGRITAHGEGLSSHSVRIDILADRAVPATAVVVM